MVVISGYHRLFLLLRVLLYDVTHPLINLYLIFVSPVCICLESSSVSAAQQITLVCENVGEDIRIVDTGVGGVKHNSPKMGDVDQLVDESVGYRVVYT